MQREENNKYRHVCDAPVQCESARTREGERKIKKHDESRALCTHALGGYILRGPGDLANVRATHEKYVGIVIFRRTQCDRVQSNGRIEKGPKKKKKRLSVTMRRKCESVLRDFGYNALCTSKKVNKISRKEFYIYLLTFVRQVINLFTYPVKSFYFSYENKKLIIITKCDRPSSPLRPLMIDISLVMRHVNVPTFLNFPIQPPPDSSFLFDQPGWLRNKIHRPRGGKKRRARALHCRAGNKVKVQGSLYEAAYFALTGRAPSTSNLINASGILLAEETKARKRAFFFSRRIFRPHTHISHTLWWKRGTRELENLLTVLRKRGGGKSRFSTAKVEESEIVFRWRGEKIKGNSGRSEGLMRNWGGWIKHVL